MEDCRKNESQLRYRTKYPMRKFLTSKKSSAKIRGIEFNLTEDVLWNLMPEFCPLIPSIRLEFNKGRCNIRNCPSLDRIDPTKGYVIGNVQWLSQRANAMKQDASKEELRMFCVNMLKWLGDN